jgi:methyl-accepting chemotaxis protein
MQFIKNLKLGQKLALTVAMLLVPVALLGFFFWQNEQGQATFAQKELDGVNYYHPLEEVISAVQSRNLLITLSFLGSPLDKSGIEALDARIDKEFAHLDELNAKFDVSASPSSRLLQETKALWRNLKSQAQTNPQSSETAHSDLSAKALETRSQIAIDWNISLDPSLISYSLLDAAVMRIPDLEHQIGHYVAAAFVAMHDKSLDRVEDHELTAARTTMLNNWAGAVGDFTNVSSSGPEGSALAAKYSGDQAKVDSALKALVAVVDQGVQGGSVVNARLSDIEERSKAAFDAVDALHDAAQDPAIESLQVRHDKLIHGRNEVLAAVAFAVALAILLAVVVSRLLTRSMAQVITVFERISAGDLGSVIPTDGKDETGRVLANLSDMQAKLKAQIEADKAVAAEVSRIKQALDHVSGNVLLADPDGKVIYLNNAINHLFSDCENDFKKGLQQFTAARVMGSSIDMFYKEPVQQRQLFLGLDRSHKDELEIGGRHMVVIATPVKSEQGDRLGTVLEWIDRTQEVLAEREIEMILEAAVGGRLSERIPLAGKAGFFAKLSKDFNDLLTVNERVIGDVQRVFSALARGEINQSIEADYQGVYAVLKQDANATVAKLVEVVQQIQMTADLVNSGSIELSRGNQNLSQRTEEQASSLEETASSMEQITSTVKNNADNSSQANQLAAAAGAVAQKGGEVVSRAVTAMGEINESSRKIAAITNVIDEIAFQTNLLALNAAVEAARAGEQGRGFAVVASEVRNLASRSATAAKEIKSLIEDSVKKVDDGSRLVDESGKTLGEIVLGVKKVTDLVGEISAASREQSAGIEEINKAVMQMDEMTQQNAALVEQAAAATEALTEQAQSLSQLTSFFVIDAGAARRTAVPAAKPVASAQPPGRGMRGARTPPSAPSPGSVRQATGTDGDDWEQF